MKDEDLELSLEEFCERYILPIVRQEAQNHENFVTEMWQSHKGEHNA